MSVRLKDQTVQGKQCAVISLETYEGNAGNAKLNHLLSSYFCTFDSCIFRNLDLQKLNCRNLQFYDCEFYKVQGRNTAFLHSEFFDSTFRFCDFEGANFKGCKFDGCSLDSNNLSYACFKNVLVRPSQFCENNLEGLDVSFADFTHEFVCDCNYGKAVGLNKLSWGSAYDFDGYPIDLYTEFQGENKDHVLSSVKFFQSKEESIRKEFTLPDSPTQLQIHEFLKGPYQDVQDEKIREQQLMQEKAHTSVVKPRIVVKRRVNRSKGNER